MKKFVIALSLLVIVGVLLAGCLPMVSPSKQEIITLVKNFPLDDLLMGSEDQDLFAKTDVTTASVEPLPQTTVYAARGAYTRGQMERVVGAVNIDEANGVATAEVSIKIAGTIELYDTANVLVGTKDATLAGSALYTANKIDGRWKIVDKKMRLATNAKAPVFATPVLEPQPVQAGQQLQIRVGISSGNGENADLFRAAARSRAGGTRTRLVDTGNPFMADQLKGDSIYSGIVTVNINATAGKHIGIMKAVAWGSIVDITKDANGAYLTPVKMTLQTFTVEVIE